MISLSEFVSARLKELGLGPIEAAVQGGIERTYIRDIIEGRKQSVRSDKVHGIARALHMTTDAFLNRELSPPADVEQQYQSIPIVSWVAAGSLDREHAQDVALGEFRTVPPRKGDWFALRVDGSSMNKISPPESVILVNQRETTLVANACYVIADQDGGATYKRWRPGPPPRFEPVTYEDGHEAFFYDNEPRIIGRVRRSIIDM